MCISYLLIRANYVVVAPQQKVGSIEESPNGRGVRDLPLKEQTLPTLHCIARKLASRAHCGQVSYRVE